MDLLLTFFTYGLPLLLAIPLHEAAHGWIARQCGDDTAERLGRVTFKPWRHVDPLGTIILPALLILTKAPVVFGWAKPVPVDFSALRDPRWDSLKVALAGPMMNLFLAFATAALWKLLQGFGWETAWLQEMLAFSLIINLALMVFNLLPILPMDGGRVLLALLPAPLARPYARTERYGMLVVMALIFVPAMLGSLLGRDFSILQWIIAPMVLWLLDLLVSLTQLQLG